MTVAALIAENPHPYDADIDRAVTNICRFGTYLRIRQAIHAAPPTPPLGHRIVHFGSAI